MKVEHIAGLYSLSPRESDVLRYLAKGRNANYIQKELVISPHTAKSHIYNIYRKLDIHSQQKLMDFVEEYPIELTRGHDAMSCG
jgi:DNA-binding CsgD family transcriptional regulator